MAQLVARLVRNEKVGGSNPPSSTTGRHPIRMSVFCMPGVVLRCLVLYCSWRRWCSGRRRARPPARSPHASLRLGVVDLEARPCPPDPPAPSTPAALCCCVWLGTSARSPARPRHRPPAPRPCPPVPPAPSTADCCRSPVGSATHVKPSLPLLACALPPVKPTTPLQVRYTCFWCYFIEQRRRGFHGDVPMSPHWCRRFHLAVR